MELTNEFRVGVSVEQAWHVLTDVERIAPCMPGAELQEIEGDEYRGVVKVKVGPITAQYKGKASFVEKDDASHRAVLRAEGRETRGQGNASATITAALSEDGDGTKVAITTDLTVTGRVAQFGRGVLADVSAKLLTQFVDCLETSVLGAGAPAPEPAAAAPAPEPAAAAPAPEPAAPASASSSAPGAAASAAPSTAGATAASEGPRRVDQGPVEPVDLLETAGAPVAKRVGPILAAIAVLWLIRLFWKRRKRA